MLSKWSWNRMKAQKWGITMGPPYPIGKKTQNKENKENKENNKHVQKDK